MENEKEEAPKEAIKKREIRIETDGTDIEVTKNECVGNLEFIAILQAILNQFRK